MSKLKPGWKQVKFGDVVRLNRETCKDPLLAGIDRAIGLEHLESGDLRVRSWGEVSDETTFTNLVRPGQVLFGKRRAYQQKVAVADFDAVCSGDIYIFGRFSLLRDAEKVTIMSSFVSTRVLKKQRTHQDQLSKVERQGACRSVS